MKPVITLLDVETAPTKGWVWKMWEADVIATDESWFMLSFAAQTLGTGKTTARILPDYKGYKKDKHNDAKLMSDLWKLLDRSDVVIAHNGDNFDIRKINARLIYHGFPPPSPYRTIDTLKIARKHFKFDSNKLIDLAEYLGVGSKLPHEGFRNTWLACMDGNKKAWDVLRRYNCHDVHPLLEGVYLKLRPWSTSHVDLNIFTKANVCGVCQSENTILRGFYMTRTGKRHRYQCQEPGCGHWDKMPGFVKTIQSL